MLCGMEKKDFRGIGRDAQEALRARAVYLVLIQRKTQAEAAEAVGVRRLAVSRWMKRHAKAGEAGLLDGRRVSPRKGKGLLTAAEARRVQGWLQDMPRAVEVALCFVDHRCGAGTDPPPAGQGSGRVDGPALPDTMGLHAAKTPLARHTTLGCRDPALAGARISKDRTPGEAGEGTYILGRRDRDQ